MKFSFVQNGGAPQTERRFCSRFRITQGPKIKNNETEIDNNNNTIITKTHRTITIRHHKQIQTPHRFMKNINLSCFDKNLEEK